METTTLTKKLRPSSPARIKKQTRLPERAVLGERQSPENYPIIVHSHLKWDWVWQRPQQFLSRFAKRHPILFVEEPVGKEGVSAPRAVLRELPGVPNIVVVQTEFPPEMLGDREQLDAEQFRLVNSVLSGPLGRRFDRPVQWFYDPMAVTAFAQQMNERAIVYDCMDQLSQFRGAPAELVKRERELLALADVVFAGGPRIHEAKREANRNCYCYGCGVDVEHFSKARSAETVIPTDVAQLGGPKLGFFGVVDERMDYDLVAAVADAHPEWQVVIIGPATKVDPAHFPQRANLHWLGGRDYGQLPAYVKSFDVCLMPFAINEATEFINPTKALEYMATGTPIVSTAIRDVVLQFSDVVDVAGSHAEFIAACERAVAAPREQVITKGQLLARRNSWESIVKRMQGHIADVLQKQERLEATAA
jgi:glycosyltransferase involved in cell wall biosynthesis